MEPGPIPTLTASAPASTRSRAAAAVAIETDRGDELVILAEGRSPEDHLESLRLTVAGGEEGGLVGLAHPAAVPDHRLREPAEGLEPRVRDRFVVIVAFDQDGKQSGDGTVPDARPCALQ